MKKLCFFVICTVSVISVFLGCSTISKTIKGSRNLVTLKMDFTDFDKIRIAHAFHATVKQGENYSVICRLDDNIVDFVDVKKTGKTLEIGLKKEKSLESATLKAYITVPNLKSLSLEGAANVLLSDFDFAHDFTLDLSGASSATGSMNVHTLRAILSGASSLFLQGTSERLHVTASGASSLVLDQLSSQQGFIELSGASHASVTITETLDANLSGASVLNYEGNPRMGKIVTTGASSILKAN